MKTVLMTFLLFMSSLCIGQMDTLKYGITLGKFSENGEYIATHFTRTPYGQPIIIKIHLEVIVPRDTIVVKPGFKKF